MGESINIVVSATKRIMRNHTMYITSNRFQDKDLVQKIKSQARDHAGRNPGMTVTVKREVSVTQQPTYYRPLLGRGRGKCHNCARPWQAHKKQLANECPPRKYWEVLWRFTNHSGVVQDWK